MPLLDLSSLAGGKKIVPVTRRVPTLCRPGRLVGPATSPEALFSEGSIRSIHLPSCSTLS